jgi:hypothetical protein
MIFPSGIKFQLGRAVMRNILYRLLYCRAGGTPLQYSLLGALGTVAALGCVFARITG